MARYNDGEWLAMRGNDGANCDSHVYFPEMGQMLLAATKNPRNDQPDYVFQNSWYVDGQQNDYEAWELKVRFLSSDHVHDISRSHPEQWRRVLDVLHQHPVVLVGPAHLHGCTHLAPAVHIVIPERNCFCPRPPGAVKRP